MKQLEEKVKNSDKKLKILDQKILELNSIIEKYRLISLIFRELIKGNLRKTHDIRQSEEMKIEEVSLEGESLLVPLIYSF